MQQISTGHRRSRGRIRTAKRGAATIELAICMPLLLLLVFGSIETSNAIHLKHTATIAAYEAVQTISSPGGTQTAGIEKATSFLNQRNVLGASITVTPTITSSTLQGTPIAVTIAIPVAQNMLSMTNFFDDWIVRSTVTMQKL